MKYAGGKGMIGKEMAVVMLSYKQPKHTTYIEPFIGGGNLFCRMAPLFDRAIGSDTNPDLILMYQALQQGWQPPDDSEITEADHARLKHAEEPSALRAFVGFGCSYGAVWFGGYWNQGGTKRTLLREHEPFKGQPERFKFMRADYRNLNQVSERCFIYCDPPYAFVSSGLYKGGGTKHFDIAEFWAQARSWAAQGATVLVSEYQAPADIPAVWEKAKLKTIGVKQGKERPHRMEKIYLVPGK